MKVEIGGLGAWQKGRALEIGACVPSCPYRRLHVNPALRDAVAADGRPGWLLAVLAGLHHSKFSALINAVSVPDRPRNVERLERIANTVGFPLAEVFVPEAQPTVEFDSMPSPPEAL